MNNQIINPSYLSVLATVEISAEHTDTKTDTMKWYLLTLTS